ncbi:MAG: signal peptide peptidase SppA, partial [Paludibacteraceae bacterium]|nr:signal peptide peptidase SppA [Paludibacteraceae bacterium]
MNSFLKNVLSTIVGLLVFSVVTTLLSMCVLVLFVVAAGQKPGLSQNSVYVIRLSGTLVERAEDDPLAVLQALIDGTDEQTLGLNEVLDNIRKAQQDPRIKGIVLKGGTLDAGYASMREIRNRLEEFRASGKFVLAYADNYTQSNYYLASVADEIMLNSQGTLSWQGLSTRILFMSRALDKLGVQMQVFKVGTFKSAVEPYVLDKMSEPNREQYQTLLQDLWHNVRDDVSRSRNIPATTLDSLAEINMTFVTQSDLMAYRLIDRVGYVNDMEELVADYCGTDDYKTVSTDQMNGVCVGRSKKTSNVVAVVYAEGDIVDQGGGGIVGDKMAAQLIDLAEDDETDAVVLRVNSPGGSAYASEQIWNAVRLVKAKKPVVVSMSDYAASGGYYISCAADRILAQPTTLTGSIGIFGLVPNIGPLADKIGLSFDGVSTHRHSGVEYDLLFGQADGEEHQMIQAEVERGYDLFVQRVADGRGISADSVRQI